MVGIKAFSKMGQACLPYQAHTHSVQPRETQTVQHAAERRDGRRGGRSRRITEKHGNRDGLRYESCSSLKSHKNMFLLAFLQRYRLVHVEISEISVYTKNNVFPGKQSTSIQKWHPRRTQVKDVNTGKHSVILMRRSRRFQMTES